MNTETETRDINRDPLTGAPGSHPVGAGVGAAGGAVAGAVIGAVGGPAGAATGAVIGGLVGGLAGKDVAEQLNPSAEKAYWAAKYREEPYHDPDYTFDDYSPAYLYGVSMRTSGPGTWDEEETNMERRWESVKGTSRLKWDQARPAVRAAWERAGKRL